MSGYTAASWKWQGRLSVLTLPLSCKPTCWLRASSLHRCTPQLPAPPIPPPSTPCPCPSLPPLAPSIPCPLHPCLSPHPCPPPLPPSPCVCNHVLSHRTLSCPPCTQVMPMTKVLPVNHTCAPHPPLRLTPNPLSIPMLAAILCPHPVISLCGCRSHTPRWSWCV